MPTYARHMQISGTAEQFEQLPILRGADTMVREVDGTLNILSLGRHNLESITLLEAISFLVYGSILYGIS